LPFEIVRVEARRPGLGFLTTNTREHTRISNPLSSPLVFIRGSKFWGCLSSSFVVPKLLDQNVPEDLR
jgi:hypothetical protein